MIYWLYPRNIKGSRCETESLEIDSASPVRFGHAHGEKKKRSNPTTTKKQNTDVIGLVYGKNYRKPLYYLYLMEHSL